MLPFCQSKVELIFRQVLQQRRTCAVADLKGVPGARPTTAQNFLNFMQLFGKFGSNLMLAPPVGSASPPVGNCKVIHLHIQPK